MTTKILCWNVAGIRARINNKKQVNYLEFLENAEWDIVCFQETKAEEQQVKIPQKLQEIYPFRIWQSTQGITQRKGLSGTAIWSKYKPIKYTIPLPTFDLEGRITIMEFDNVILLTVYTPNSQKRFSERFEYRTQKWDEEFKNYVNLLNSYKPTILCGDFNVSNEDIDVLKPKQWRNKLAGFLDEERNNFKNLLNSGWIDCLRIFYPNVLGKFTYWDQRVPSKRQNNEGWRLDYFIVPDYFKDSVVSSEIHPEIIGSDHCPVSLIIKN